MKNAIRMDTSFATPTEKSLKSLAESLESYKKLSSSLMSSMNEIMKTYSAYSHFVISGQKQVEMFVDAIESSANNRPVRIPVAARELTDTNDIIKLMEKRKKANVAKR